MTPKLIDYTYSGNKIPSYILNHPSVETVETVEVKSSKILAAFFLDFTVIMTSALLISGFIQLSLDSFMVTNSLHNAFENIQFLNLTLQFLPVFYVGYFFFSYFFNHGQTWGMSVMKYRIEMKEMNFRASFIWAIFSSALVMTGGLSFLLSYKWMQRNHLGEVKSHDHLYYELMMVGSSPSTNVLPFSVNQKMKQFEETYQKAA